MVKGKRHRVAKAQRHRETEECHFDLREKSFSLCVFFSLCLCIFVPLSLGLDEGIWGRNPFLTREEVNSLRKKETSPTSGVVSLPLFLQWEVKSIFTSGSSRVATVNDHIVKVGDFLGEEMILEIREDSVVLGGKGRRRVLRQRQPSVLIKVEERR